MRAPATLVQAVFGVRELLTGFSLAAGPTRADTSHRASGVSGSRRGWEPASAQGAERQGRAECEQGGAVRGGH